MRSAAAVTVTCDRGDSWPTSGHHSWERRWVAQEAKLQGQLPNSGIDGVLAMTPKVGDLKVLSRSPENPIRNFEEFTTFKSPRKLPVT